jgi:hypothetical protein
MVLLTGCGPTIIAYPPPTMLPGTLDAPEPGKVDLAVGTSVWAGDGGAALNFWGGGMLGAAAFGLPENVDLSLTASRTLQGPTFGLQGGWDAFDTDKLDIAPIVALGFSSNHDAGTVTQKETDEEGVVTEVEESWDFTYFTVAPGLGARLVYRPTPWLSVPVLLRGSHSWAIAGRGVGQAAMPEATWLEAQLGAVVRPVPAFGIGVGAGMYTLIGEDGAAVVWPYPHLNASLDVQFGGKPAR